MQLVHLDAVKPANLKGFMNIIKFWAWYVHPATNRYPSARKMFWVALNGSTL